MAQSLGRYVLERKLAMGGMAEVFLAQQAGPGGYSRPCVVKKMHAALTADPDAVRMFLAEARLTANLVHPHIAQVYDFGEVDGTYFMAIEYVPGLTLSMLNRSFVRGGQRLPVPEVLKLVADAARGLDYAHSATTPEGRPLALVHRDISPQNILVSTTGVVKVIDFGIAKVATSTVVTRDGFLKGKLPYMAPEQVLGEELDRRTDVYGLALVLWELLAGRRAYTGESDTAIMMAVAHQRMPALVEIRPGLSSSLYELVSRALAPQREDRFQSAGELATALETELMRTSEVVSAERLSALVRTAMAQATEPEVSAATQLARPRPAAAPESKGDEGLSRESARAVRGNRGPWIVALLALIGVFAAGVWFTSAAQTKTAVPDATDAAVVTGVPDATDAAVVIPDATDAAVVTGVPDATDAAVVTGVSGATGDAGDTAAATTAPDAGPEPTGRGRLDLQVQPFARVKLDGRALGETPFDGPVDVALGRHVLELANPEEGLKVVCSIQQRARTTLRVNLRAPGTASGGRCEAR